MTTAKTRPLDPAEYLDNDAAIAAYITKALETDDPSFVADALGVVARALGLQFSISPIRHDDAA